VAVLAALFGLGSLPAGAATTTTTLPLANTPQNAKTLLSAAVNDAQRRGSVNFLDRTTGTTQELLQGAVSAPTAGETLTLGGDSVTVELVGGTVYVRGASALLTNALGISTAQAAFANGKWVAIQPSDAPFQLLTGTLNIQSTIGDFLPDATKPLRIGKVTTVGGKKVIPIIGSPISSVAGRAKGSAALFVADKYPFLPVAGSLVLKQQKDTLLESAAFKDWGVPVQLSAPTGAIPFQTVLTSAPTG